MAGFASRRWERALEHLGSAFADEAGAVMPIFGMVLLLLLACMGAALDLGLAMRAKGNLQANLDATALALASHPEGASAERGVALFNINSPRGGYFGPSPTFTFLPNGTVEADARMKMKTYLLTLFGFAELPVEARAKAAPDLDDQIKVNFKINSVKGWFAKDIYAVARDKDGNTLSETKVLGYDYDYVTDTHTIDPPIASATQELSIDGAAAMVLKMRVWPDYPLSGSSRNRVAPIDYFSDDPNARLIRSGACRDGQKYEWEDAPNDIDPSEDDYQDFVFTVTCLKMPGEVVNARLTE